LSERTDVAALTDPEFWDRYWKGQKLPIVVEERRATPYQREILAVFRRFVPQGAGKTTVEIGGAPGGYLAWLVNTFQHDAYAIDISPVGCRMLEENFRALDLPIHVYCMDALTGDLSGIPRFDVVYSLGLIEHFSDPTPMMRRHVELAKPGGLVIVGMPNFLGVSKAIIKMTRPELFDTHNLGTMDIRSWQSFEKAIGVDVLFRGYIGGWEPRIYAARRAGAAQLLNRPIQAAAKAMDLMRPLRGLNNRAWSGYAMGVYRTPS
jgi:SAM-dependent methyltransferase